MTRKPGAKFARAVRGLQTVSNRKLPTAREVARRCGCFRRQNQTAASEGLGA
jgi:hypothetical protein